MTHRGGLGTVKDGYVRIVNASDKSKPELFRGSFDQAGPRSAILICKLFRAGAKWKLFTMMEPSYGTFYEQMIPKLVTLIFFSCSYLLWYPDHVPSFLCFRIFILLPPCLLAIRPSLSVWSIVCVFLPVWCAKVEFLITAGTDASFGRYASQPTAKRYRLSSSVAFYGCANCGNMESMGTSLLLCGPLLFFFSFLVFERLFLDY